jgi:hypothetical protein
MIPVMTARTVTAALALLSCGRIEPTSPPRLLRVEPGVLLEGEEVELAIHGEGFFVSVEPAMGRRGPLRTTAAFAAELGGVSLGPVTWVSNRELRATCPPGLPVGAWDLVVRTPGGAEAALARAVWVRREAAATGGDVEQTAAGAASLDTDDLFVEVPLSPAVVPERSVLFFNIAHPSYEPSDGHVTGQIVSGGSALRFERYGVNGVTAPSIRWSVLQHSAFSVQRGSALCPAGLTRITLDPPVDLARSFPLATLRISGTNYNFNDWIRATLVDASTLELTFGNDEENVNAVVEWQVVTLSAQSGAVVSSGTSTLPAGSQLATVALPAPPPPAQSLLFVTHESVDWNAVAAENLIAAELATDGTLVFTREGSAVNAVISWSVLTWDALEVVHQVTTFNAGETRAYANLPCPARPAAAISLLAAGMRQGRSPFAADDTPGVAWFTTELRDAGCTLVLERGATDDGAYAPWSVAWLR